MQVEKLELIDAIESNLREYAEYRAASPMLDLHDLGDVAYMSSESGVHFANQVFHSQLTDSLVDQRIDEIMAFFEKRNLSMSWLTGPSTTPKDLGVKLIERGFIHHGSTPGMAIELGDLRELPAVDGLEILQVQESEQMDLSIPVLAESYEMPVYYAEFLVDLYASLGFDQERWVYYLGLYKGAPVGTSCVFYGGGVAGIYSVATISGARGLGIGSALTLAPLHEAFERGCKIGVLRSSAMATQLYQKRGFEKICRFDDYSLIKGGGLPFLHRSPQKSDGEKS